MLRRVLLPVVIAAGLMTHPATAATVEERVIAELREAGFTAIETSRTLLGRTRILAVGPNSVREIIINPATGVILRDFLREGSDSRSGGSDRGGRSGRSNDGAGDTGSRDGGGNDDDSDADDGDPGSDDDSGDDDDTGDGGDDDSDDGEDDDDDDDDDA